MAFGRGRMSRLSFESTETLVYDPVAANRTATRAALFTLGFRHIETVATIDAFQSSIRRRPPDLALCEAQGADGELCAMIQELRQGSAGFNPFIVIIVTAWEKSTALVTRVVNSGADDLLLRPFSTALLNQRIETHVERRKGFVVTSDYVGPDRRKDVSRPSNVELFNPPNSLKMKAKDRLSAEETAQRLDAELKSARELLNSEKLRRDAFQIAILWRMMQEEIPGAPTYKQELEKIGALARGVARRCADSNLVKAEEWCDSIVAAVEGLEAGVDRTASMHLLGHASLSLNHVFHTEKASEDILSEINATVAIIRAREMTKLEAQAS
jgi:DNA-binding response OmpR family regulator